MFAERRDHRNRELSRRDKCQRPIADRLADIGFTEGTADETGSGSSSYSGMDDLRKGATCVGGAQWCFFGSDHADSRVTPSILRSRRPTS